VKVELDVPHILLMWNIYGQAATILGYNLGLM
jgi:hypothetical protein